MILTATRMIFLPIPMQILQIYVFCNHRIVKKKKFRWYENNCMKANTALAKNFQPRPFFPQVRILKNREVATKRFYYLI